MNFGDRLKKLRESRNISQEEFGKSIRKNRTTIIGYEKDNRTPDINTIIRIADFFGVTVDFLIGRSDYKNLEDQKILPVDKDFFAAVEQPEIRTEIINIRDEVNLLLFNAYNVIRKRNLPEEIVIYYEHIKIILKLLNSIQNMSLNYFAEPSDYIRKFTQYKHKLENELNELSISYWDVNILNREFFDRKTE